MKSAPIAIAASPATSDLTNILHATSRHDLHRQAMCGRKVIFWTGWFPSMSAWFDIELSAAIGG
jgi:hypothetical protein